MSCEMTLDAGAGLLAGIGVQAQGEFPARADRIDEFAVAGAQIENRVVGLHPALEEMAVKTCQICLRRSSWPAKRRA